MKLNVQIGKKENKLVFFNEEPEFSESKLLF
jgi:hypothetical protein